jgi:hypothetical protein
MGMVFFVDAMRRRGRVTIPTVLFIALFIVCSIVREYRLVEMVFASAAAASQRSEVKIETYGFVQAVRESTLNFLAGQYHALPLSRWVIVPLSFVALIATFLAVHVARHTREVREAVYWRRRLVWCLAAIALTAFIYGFLELSSVEAYRQSLKLPYLNLTRFSFLQPTGWAIAFALSLAIISALLRQRRNTAVVAILIFSLSQFAYAIDKTDEFEEPKVSGINFAEFFSTPLFDDIKHAIGKDPSTYRIVSVGIHPSVTQYNGFYTIDGYLGLYPLSYKKKFRRIMAPELAQFPKRAQYYDNWGSRVYIFSRELEPCAFICTKARAPNAISLRLDIAALRALGDNYLFSPSQLTNSDDLGLKLFGVYEHPDSPWRIYVYQVPPAG